MFEIRRREVRESVGVMLSGEQIERIGVVVVAVAVAIALVVVVVVVVVIFVASSLFIAAASAVMMRIIF